MENFKGERDRMMKGRMMSSNDHVRNWQRKKMKSEGAAEKGVSGREREKQEEEKRVKLESPQRKKNLADRSRVLRSQRKSAVCLDLKAADKCKPPRETGNASKPETKRLRTSKPGEKPGRKESVVLFWERKDKPTAKKLSNFSSTWDFTNYSGVPSGNVNGDGGRIPGEEKRTRTAVEKTGRQTGGRSKTPAGENKREGVRDARDRSVEVAPTWKKKVVQEPTTTSFVKEEKRKENGGEAEGADEAIVIFQRQNGRNYLNPNFAGDYHHLEEISFGGGSRDTTLEASRSKRSLSDPPGQKSLNEFYVARRRTRLQLKPEELDSVNSGFHSGNVEVSRNDSKKIDRIKSDYRKESAFANREKLVEEDEEDEEEDDDEEEEEEEEVESREKFRRDSFGRTQTVAERKSKTNAEVTKVSSDKDDVERRLKDLAEKKLNLHREMRRLERMDRKKFWESIKQSLNYRCALAEMFSSQSFLSQNESAKIFSSTENSTEIFVRESVISSYQGFRRFDKSPIAASQKKTNQTSGSTFHQMKKMFGSILIKEEEEEGAEEEDEEEEREDEEENILRNCLFRKNVDFRRIVEEEKEKNMLPKKLTMMETNLINSSTELEILMGKLSKEIKTCTEFVKKFPTFDRDKNSLRFFESDKDLGEADKRKLKSGFGALDRIEAYPMVVFPAAEAPPDDPKNLDMSLSDIYPPFEAKGKDRNTSKQSFSPAIGMDEVDLKRSRKSDSTVKSTSSGFNRKDLKGRDRRKDSTTKDDSYCDDCKYLKKRIIRLEKELERIERKMPFYPADQQDSMKTCLEKLKATSETVLRRLRSCAKLRYDDQLFSGKKKDCSKRSRSAPDPIVKNEARRKLSIKPSNSDYSLNVGMEITMENFDPVTGKKLHPEAVGSIPEQEGNIQCKVFRSGEKPVLVMDTDFSYNPETGMLFKQGLHKTESHHSVDFLLPKDELYKLDSTNNIHRSFGSDKTLWQSYECSYPRNAMFEDMALKSRQKYEKSITFEEPSCPVSEYTESEKRNSNVDCTEDLDQEEKFPVEEETRKANLQNSKISPKDKEKIGRLKQTKSRLNMPCFLKKKPSKEKNSSSRIPRRRKTTPNSIKDKSNTLTPKTSVTSCVKSEISNDDQSRASETSTKKLAKLFSFTWTFGFLLCKLVHYMQSVSAVCSVLTLTAMSLERYYAIVHPMKAQYICTISQARKIIAATWISAFLLAIPILFAQVHLRVGIKVEAYWCVRDWDNKTIWRAHELYMMLLILVVPTGVMAVAYTAICCEIWEVIQRRQDMTSGKGHDARRKSRVTRASSNEDSFPSSNYTANLSLRTGSRKKMKRIIGKEDDGASVKQVIKMLVAVVAIYVLCWGPMLIDNVLQAYGVLSHIRLGWLKYMGTAFHLMAYFNSCINPIIYGFMSKNFRESFTKAICCRGKKPKLPLRSFSLSQTRNTSVRYAESSFGRTVSVALPV